MKHCAPLILIFTLFLTYSCDFTFDENNTYSDVAEINIPVGNSLFGLTYDGEYLWYSDDSLGCLNKISASGEILKTIKLDDRYLTGIEFYENHFWCLHDTTVFRDTTISHYPFSCVYKVTTNGKVVDSILIEASVNPIRPELIGITFNKGKMYLSTYRGWSSSLLEVDIETGEDKFLQYHYLNGLASKGDTIYVIDKSYMNTCRIFPLDSAYILIQDRVIPLDFNTSDLAFVGEDIWVCDREAGKLRRVN